MHLFIRVGVGQNKLYIKTIKIHQIFNTIFVTLKKRFRQMDFELITVFRLTYACGIQVYTTHSKQLFNSVKHLNFTIMTRTDYKTNIFRTKRKYRLSSLPGVASQDGSDGSSLAVSLTCVPCWSTQKHTDASHCTGKYFPSGVQ